MGGIWISEDKLTNADCMSALKTSTSRPQAFLIDPWDFIFLKSIEVVIFQKKINLVFFSPTSRMCTVQVLSQIYQIKLKTYVQTCSTIKSSWTVNYYALGGVILKTVLVVTPDSDPAPIPTQGKMVKSHGRAAVTGRVSTTSSAATSAWATTSRSTSVLQWI